MRIVLVTCVFLLGVYFGLHAERGGELQALVETIAEAVIDRTHAW